MFDWNPSISFEIINLEILDPPGTKQQVLHCKPSSLNDISISGEPNCSSRNRYCFLEIQVGKVIAAIITFGKCPLGITATREKHNQLLGIKIPWNNTGLQSINWSNLLGFDITCPPLSQERQNEWMVDLMIKSFNSELLICNTDRGGGRMRWLSSSSSSSHSTTISKLLIITSNEFWIGELQRRNN